MLVPPLPDEFAVPLEAGERENRNAVLTLEATDNSPAHRGSLLRAFGQADGGGCATFPVAPA